MIHQARAESTRRAILHAAVEVFEEVGYSNAPLTEVIDRAEVTKGAFYYHFPTKIAVASALIADADDVVEGAIRSVWDSSSSATVLESLIRAAFVVADRARFDRRVRVGIRLTEALGNERADPNRHERQRGLLVDAVGRAIAQGDIRPEVNAHDLGHTLWVSLLGNHLLSETAGEDLTAALARVLRIILVGVCTDRSALFFEQFVDRLALRYALPTARQLLSSTES